MNGELKNPEIQTFKFLVSDARWVREPNPEHQIVVVVYFDQRMGAPHTISWWK